MRDSALALLPALTEAHGAPGHEDAVREIFRRELEGCGEFACDRLGSISCLRKEPGPVVMLTAHMDEVGFMVQNVTSAGFLQIVPLGGWWTHNLLAQRVRVLTRSGREIPGVISATPPHFLSDAERNKVLPIEQLFVDVGARSQQEAVEEFGIRLGDPLVPDTTLTPMANPDHLMAKAFDNRAGMGVIIQATQMMKDREIHCTLATVGTVQEEVGCRGAQTAAALVKPDVALLLEGTPADDTPGSPSGAVQGALGKGVQIRVMDPTALMSRRLVDFVIEVATAKGIPHQVAVRRSGGTDAKSIHLSGLGVPCVVLGVPARYIHSHQSVIDINDYLGAVSLVTELIACFDKSTVASFTDFLG